MNLLKNWKKLEFGEAMVFEKLFEKVFEKVLVKVLLEKVSVMLEFMEEMEAHLLLLFQVELVLLKPMILTFKYKQGLKKKKKEINFH